MKGLGSNPPPIGQSLHQDDTSKSLKQQMDDGLEAHSTYMGPSLLGKDSVPYQYLVSTPSVGVWR